MIPEFHKGTFIYGEHVVRYRAVEDLVKGKVVLDIASGSGYGSQILSKTAKKVYGVEIDERSVAYAQEHFSSQNLEFMQGDAIKIPLKDGSVDVVVTFETLEHIADYKQFIREIKRVLRPKGIAVISTPNDTEFSEGNHFHLYEFNHTEFQKLLKANFSHTKEYFQGTWIYNALLEKDHFVKEFEFSGLPTINAAPKPISKSLYFYALCSDRAIDENVNELGAISHHWSARDEQSAGDEANAYVASLKAHIEATEAKLAATTTNLAASNARLERITGNPVVRVGSKIRRSIRK